MSIDEYIKNDSPFYHITKMDIIPKILNNGLCKQFSEARDGICVVRSCEEEIINEIIDTQLHTLDVPNDTLYALIKLIPSKHKITADIVAPDDVSDPNGSLYNYLCVDSICISEDDIIKRNLSIGNFRGTKNLPELIIELENYHRATPPLVKQIKNNIQ